MASTVPTGTSPHRDQQLVDHAVLEDLDLDFGLAGVHERDYVAALDLIARLDVPFEHRPGLHDGAQHLRLYRGEPDRRREDADCEGSPHVHRAREQRTLRHAHHDDHHHDDSERRLDGHDDDHEACRHDDDLLAVGGLRVP